MDDRPPELKGLTVFHKVTITSAVSCCALLAFRFGQSWLHSRSAIDAAVAIGALIGGVCLAFYLRAFFRHGI